MYLKAALGSERLIQSYRVVWGALRVEIVLLSLMEALLDVRTLFHNVVSVKSGLVTAEIFFYLHKGSQTTSSILQASGLPPSPTMDSRMTLTSPHLFLERGHVALTHNSNCILCTSTPSCNTYRVSFCICFLFH